MATYARNVAIVNNQFTANLPKNLRVKSFFKSVKIWQNYGHEFNLWPHFLAHPAYRDSTRPADCLQLAALLMDHS